VVHRAAALQIHAAATAFSAQTYLTALQELRECLRKAKDRAWANSKGEDFEVHINRKEDYEVDHDKVMSWLCWLRIQLDRLPPQQQPAWIGSKSFSGKKLPDSKQFCVFPQAHPQVHYMRIDGDVLHSIDSHLRKQARSRGEQEQVRNRFIAVAQLTVSDFVCSRCCKIHRPSSL
jgi:hypothetical protein